MKILFSISGFEYGGSEIFLIRLVSELSKDADIFILNTEPEVKEPGLIKSIPSSVKLYTLPALDFFKRSKIAGFFERKFAIRYRIHKWFTQNLIRKNKIDLVVSFKYHSDAFITAALDNMDVSLIVSTRGCYSVLDKSLDHNSAHYSYFVKEIKRIFKRVDGLIWLTDENLQILKKNDVVIPRYACQIYNGFNRIASHNDHPLITKIRSTSTNSFIFGMVARGDEIKGWKELLEAFELLQQQTKVNVELVIVGDGVYLNTLKKAYVLNDKIHFAGFLSDSFDCIQGFDAAVLASRLDTMPNTIIEYLASGKAIIASKVGEIPNMLSSEHGMAGILIDLDNDKIKPELLAEKMLLLINDITYKEELENLTQKAFEKFSMEKCTAAYLHFFQKTIVIK